MVEKSISGHKVVFYDGIEELPIIQFHRYSKYVLIDSNIGDNIADIDRHITKIVNFLGDPRKAYTELNNLRQNMYFVVEGQDIHHKSTLCLVKSIDGKDWEDFSDSGLEELYNMLNKASVGEMEELANNLRGAIDRALEQYFPSIFDSTEQKNINDLLHRRAMLQLATIVSGEDNDEKIRGVDAQLFARQRPKNFIGEQSEEIRFDKQFEEMCLTLAKEFGGNIKRFTTMEFYSAVEKLNKDSKELKKLKKK